MTDLDETTAPARILRVGRKPNPWAWPRWEIAGEDGTFGNRWDDAGSTYRVLYGSSQLEACFVETLARFRPDPHVLAELARIEGPEAALAPGLLPRSWLAGRVVGEGTVPGRFCRVGTAVSLAHLHRALAATLVRHGIAELDGAAIRGDRYRNWAIFERPAGRPVIRNPSTKPIDPTRREFRAALRLLGLRLGA
jgi:hypothetical protein